MSFTRELRPLLRLGAPVLVTQVGVVAVSFADTAMVGRYGVEELAASAFVNSVFLVVIVMIIGLANGLTPIVGALYAQNDTKGCGRMLRAALMLNTGVATLFTIAMGALYFFLDHMGQPPELMPLIKQYYLITLFSVVPAAVFGSCQQMANGTTDTASPMWIMIGGNVLNVVGNYALIYGRLGMPEMGLAGAGISTLTARVLSAVAMLSVLLCRRRYRPYRVGMRDRSVGRRQCREVWHTSYPVMLQSGVECLLWSFGAVVCGWFGKVQLAAYQTVNILGQLGFMIYMSFGVAVSVRAANLTGVADYGGVRQTLRAGLLLNWVLATLASLAFLLFETPLLSIFTDDAAVMASALTLMQPLVIYQYCDAAQLTYANAQRGTARVRPLLWASLISYVLVGVPAALLFASGMGWGNLGVYYSFCVALLLMALLLRYWFNRTLRSLEEA